MSKNKKANTHLRPWGQRSLLAWLTTINGVEWDINTIGEYRTITSETITQAHYDENGKKIIDEEGKVEYVDVNRDELNNKMFVIKDMPKRMRSDMFSWEREKEEKENKVKTE